MVVITTMDDWIVGGMILIDTDVVVAVLTLLFNPSKNEDMVVVMNNRCVSANFSFRSKALVVIDQQDGRLN